MNRFKLYQERTNSETHPSERRRFLLLDSTEDYKKVSIEKALKRLEELSLKSINSLRDIPELEEPTYEQQEWMKRKTWRTKQ